MNEYYIVTTNHDGRKQFLVDRKKIRYKRFWSPRLSIAQPFDIREEAEERMAKLKYNSPEIVNKKEAIKIAQVLKAELGVKYEQFQPVKTLAQLRHK
jgi:hypothetical protein